MKRAMSLRNFRPFVSSWRQVSGVLAGLAMVVVIGGLAPAPAHAQKNINFTTTGSVRSTLVFGNQISPDVYSFFATAGERIRVETSNFDTSVLDTTLRVVGPDASINLFDDDGGATFHASRLVFTTDDTGTYLVIVSSFSGNPGGGDYTLTFARGAAAGAAAALSAMPADPQAGESMSDVDNAVEEK